MKWPIPVVFVQDNQVVKSLWSIDIRSFLVIALHDLMRVLNFILGIAGVYIRLRMNGMNYVKYEWTNEVDSMFANNGPRVEVPYVGPSLEMYYATSMIPKSRVYEMYYI